MDKPCIQKTTAYRVYPQGRLLDNLEDAQEVLMFEKLKQWLNTAGITPPLGMVDEMTRDWRGLLELLDEHREEVDKK